MATEIKSLITVCLPFQKVKLNGTWYKLTDAAVKELEEARKHPMVWVYIIVDRGCNSCSFHSQCINAQ